MGRGRNPGPSRRGVDLTGIISFAEKEDLVILVSRITETMIRQMGDVFDSSTPTLVGPGTPNANTWVTISIPMERLGMDDKPDIKSESDETAGGTSVDTTDHNTGTIISPALSMPITTQCQPQLSELKKELFAVFKKWQGVVLQRVRDIRVMETTLQDHYEDQNFFGGRGRGYRGGRAGGRGGRGRGGVVPRTTGPLRPQPFSEADPQLVLRFRPSPTPLWQLPLANRKRLLHVVLLLLLSLEEYTAYSRNFMFHLTSSLHLPLSTYQEAEVQLAQGLGQSAVDFDPVAALKLSEELKAARKGSRPGPDTAQPPRVTNMLSRGLIATGVGVLFGAGGLGKIAAAGLLGPMSEIGISVGGLFGIYMAKSSVKPMDAYTKDIQNFAFVPMHGKVQTAIKESSEIYHEDRRLRLVIAVNGWLLSDGNIANPWRCFGNQGEVHAFRWETNTLRNLGTALDTVIQSGAWNTAKQMIASQDIIAIMDGNRWPAGLLKISKIIDIPWSIGMVRADKAGLILADTIQRKVHGSRPVTLVGYSLASRVIYTCLMALAERRQFGLIDSVVMIGTPAPSETRVWLTLRSVVAGRLVNVYSENDYMLGFMMRTSNTQFGIAGLQPIMGALGIENYDASTMVSGHLRYQFLIGTILKGLGWEDLDHGHLARDQETLAATDAKYSKSKHANGSAPSFYKENNQQSKKAGVADEVLVVDEAAGVASHVARGATTIGTMGSRGRGRT